MIEVRRKIFNLYNKIPYRIKKKLALSEKIIPYNIVFGKKYKKILFKIKSFEYLSRNALDIIINKGLSDILLYAFNNTSYYSNNFKKAGLSKRMLFEAPRESLAKIEFVNKRIMMDRFNEFLAFNWKKISKDYVSTGGTSGEPFYFYINSNRSTKEWAYITDQWSRVSYTIKSRRATFRGSRIQGNDWEDDWITRERKFSSFQLTDEYLEKIWPAFHDFEPEFVYAYPSTAISICQFMEKHNKRLPQTVKAWLLGSENIYDGQREQIESISGKRVFLWYGHSEKLVLAAECENGKYYHAYPQYGYVEFINEQGEPAKPGEFAEIVGTGFINSVMPFIRYRTGDYCTYLGDHCPQCGRNYQIFEKVRGRWTQEVLIGSGGNRICMSAINLHSNSMENIFRFQFSQKQPGITTLRIVPKLNFSERDRRAIEKEFNDKFNGSVRVNATVVENIPLTRIGKWKFIDQLIEGI